MKTLRPFLTLLALVTLAGWLQAEPVPPRPAPKWTLQDVDGKAVSSNQFKGKVVVVDFWATWCVPCRAEIPNYIALQDKYRADGLVIVGISVDRLGPKVVKAFIKEHHLNYVVVMGDDDIASDFGGLEGFPTTFIIDRAGNIRDRKIGVADAAEYEQTLLKYLKK